jgi:urease subunit gamma/beta
VRLTPWEEERLLIFAAAELARRHRAAGLALNAPEATALICDAMLEAARAGGSYADVEAAGLAAVAPHEVIDGVRELVDDVRLEVLLEDGARLIVLVDPLGRGAAHAADGPGAVVAGHAHEGADASTGDARKHPPSEDGRPRIELEVRSRSTRAIRVSSHFPFDRVNARLEFDRAAAAGYRLDVTAGSSVRWAPGESKRVTLVRYGGEAGGNAGGDAGVSARGDTSRGAAS